MNHPDRINTWTFPSRARWRLPAMGWLTIYTLAALMFGALAYFIGG